MARMKSFEDLIAKRIAGFEPGLDVAETGVVSQVGDGVARLTGLGNVMASELLEFPGNAFGIAMNLEKDEVGAILLGEGTHIHEGDEVRRTGRIAEVPVGEALLGRVVNALGQPIDGKGPIKAEASQPLARNTCSALSCHRRIARAATTLVI